MQSNKAKFAEENQMEWRRWEERRIARGIRQELLRGAALIMPLWEMSSARRQLVTVSATLELVHGCNRCLLACLLARSLTHPPTNPPTHHRQQRHQTDRLTTTLALSKQSDGLVRFQSSELARTRFLDLVQFLIQKWEARARMARMMVFLTRPSGEVTDDPVGQ